MKRPKGVMGLTFLKVKFRKKTLNQRSGEIHNGGQRVSVRNDGGIELLEITTGSPGTIRFRDHAERHGPGRRRTLNNPCFLHIKKLRPWWRPASQDPNGGLWQKLKDQGLWASCGKLHV